MAENTTISYSPCPSDTSEVIPYVPPALCVGSWTIKNECTDAHDSVTIENQIAESLEIAGAEIKIFKLLGVHEQGKLIDLTGQGYPLSSGAGAGAGSDAINAFDISASSWQSAQLGTDVVASPAYLGYNFGTVKTSTNNEKYAPPARLSHRISTLRIKQGANAVNRAVQLKVEQASGRLKESVSFVGSGNGQLINVQPGYFPNECTVILTAISTTSFSVMSSLSGPLSNISVGQPFASRDIRFSISSGNIPFAIGDTFIIELTLDWVRVDIVNVPDSANLETISVRLAAPAPFWRIVPLLFNGGLADYWEVEKLEMIDYEATSINNIQDTLFLENRDRDYAQCSIGLKCQYQPFDSVGDLGKFGFSILDQYIFTCSFARMVQLLGRPIVVGDVLEVTPELAYDQNLRPVKKFLEVTDTGWSSESYTAQWNPVLFRFQAVQLLPSIEVRDIIPMPEEVQSRVSDGEFFDKMAQVDTTSIIASKTTEVEAQADVPETGENIQELSTEIPEMWKDKIVPQQTGLYVEDGMPPNGLPYTEGYKLPDTNLANDGDYFRLNYEKNMNIPVRLYKFSALKQRWMYVETDMRQSYSSHKPSIRNALVSLGKKSLQDDV